ncbi:TauD/TfdA family dioxygenase [Lacisediminimonas sp.]|uniref:TauD/TfdA dioxygenase family protein n=1 Tax=Lacisediminimonas sp. TaxID=3060582 RepID=UPI00272B43FD|nr:TauD/TfdA family dioxygenase [Lacisediminimonas sp.]
MSETGIPTEKESEFTMLFKQLAVPLASEVVDVDLSRSLDDDSFKAIDEAFNDRGVLVFRGQQITPEQHIRFSRRFGELEIHVLKQYLLADAPEILVISNMMKDGKPVGIADAGQQWHTDLSYVEKPSRCSILYAKEIPAPGRDQTYGDTCFVSTEAAYDSLDPDMKAYLGTLQAKHSYLKRPHIRKKLSEEQKQAVPDVIHPVIRTHPVTGRKCVYVNESFTTEIIGLKPDESDALIRQLCALCESERFMYRHKWRVGDILMWDNCSTQHLAVADYGPDQHRLMNRTTVAGPAVF